MEWQLLSDATTKLSTEISIWISRYIEFMSSLSLFSRTISNLYSSHQREGKLMGSWCLPRFYNSRLLFYVPQSQTFSEDLSTVLCLYSIDIHFGLSFVGIMFLEKYLICDWCRRLIDGLGSIFSNTLLSQKEELRCQPRTLTTCEKFTLNYQNNFFEYFVATFTLLYPPLTNSYDCSPSFFIYIISICDISYLITFNTSDCDF